MLKLTIDAQRWRNHLTAFAKSCPGIVPVTKGNGYGLGAGVGAGRGGDIEAAIQSASEADASAWWKALSAFHARYMQSRV